MGFSVSSELYKTKMRGNKNLSEKYLFFKVTSALRPSSLHHADTRLFFTPHHTTLTYGDLTFCLYFYIS